MRRLFLFIIMALCLARPAYAGPDAADAFRRSRCELGLLAGYGVALDRHPGEPTFRYAVFMPSLSVPLAGELGNSFYRGVPQLQIEPVVGVIVHPNDKVEAGLTAGLKYNLTGLKSRWLPYISAGLGGIYEPVGRDIQGTDFNFLIQNAYGIYYFLDEGRALNVQFRYRHISNARIKTPNSSINSAFVLIGISFF